MTMRIGGVPRIRSALLFALVLSAFAERSEATRSRMPLECFDLGALRYAEYRSPEAIVFSPDNVIHRVRQGDYLGLNDGRVVRVTRDAIDIVEIVPDGGGGWIERPVVLRRNDDAVDGPPELLVDHCRVPAQADQGGRH